MQNCPPTHQRRLCHHRPRRPHLTIATRPFSPRHPTRPQARSCTSHLWHLGNPTRQSSTEDGATRRRASPEDVLPGVSRRGSPSGGPVSAVCRCGSSRGPGGRGALARSGCPPRLRASRSPPCGGTDGRNRTCRGLPPRRSGGRARRATSGRGARRWRRSLPTRSCWRCSRPRGLSCLMPAEVSMPA